MNNIFGGATMINRSVRAMLFAILAFTLPVFASSPEHLVGETSAAPADRYRANPATATNGTDYFVVWMDWRSGSRSVIGTRITREGQILDPLGIRIGSAFGWMTEAQVVWDGEAYLVAWISSESDNDYDTNIYAARITPAGEIVMAPRMIVENAILDDGRFLASNGTVSVLVYLGDEGGRMAVFDRNVETIRTEALPGADRLWYPAVAAGANGFVVAWTANAFYSEQESSIEAVTLDATGHVNGTPKTIGVGEHPSIASNGSRYAIAWKRNFHWSEWTMRSRTFDANLQPIGEDLSHFTDTRQLASVDVVEVGSGFEIFGTRSVAGGQYDLISIAVNAAGHAQPLITRNQLLGELWLDVISPASNGSDILVARVIDSTAGKQVFTQLYRGNATAPSVPSLVSWSGNAHRRPRIASGPAGNFVAWVENDGVFATRVDSIGRSLDGRGIQLTNFRYSMTDVAFDGTNWVVAWREQSSIKIRTIAPADGSTVAETQIALDTWPTFAITASPEATYIAFIDSRVRVTRIPHATHTPDPVPVTVSPEEMDFLDHPAVSWNGSQLLVVWNEQYVDPRADPPLVISTQIWGARVTASLSLLDPAPLHIAGTLPAANDSFSPASVASNGNDWLVVMGSDVHDILARRVGRDGTFDSNAPAKIGDGITPAVTWDGSRYAAAWKGGEDYALTRPLLLYAVPGYGPLAATNRTLVALDVLSEGPISMAPVAATEVATPNPAATAASAVAYTRVSYRPEHAGVQRSFFRVMDYAAAPRGRVIRR